jgi:hypothetical protein
VKKRTRKKKPQKQKVIHIRDADAVAAVRLARRIVIFVQRTEPILSIDGMSVLELTAERLAEHVLSLAARGKLK